MLGRFLAFFGMPGPRGLGCRGERIARRYLEKQGLEILGQNVRLGRYEIDLVAEEEGALVFVEVKSRTERPGSEETGFEKLDARKRAALRKACRLYCSRCSRDATHYRLDLVTVEFEAGERKQRVREVRWFPAVLDLDS